MNAFRDAPAAERPASPPASYGVPQEGGELIDWRHVIERLTDATAYWLATTSAEGRPHVVPVWGVLVDDDVYLDVGAFQTAKVRNLTRDPRVQVHLDGAEDVVIVAGTAELVQPTAGIGEAVCRAFAAKYPGYTPAPDDWGPNGQGALVRLDPDTVLAWRDMPTATRWRLRRASPSG